MKKILYVIWIISSLSVVAQEIQSNSHPQKATELELFLFKIGFTLMLHEFENEKNTTKLNTTDIKELKANVKYILQQMNQNKLGEMDNKVIINKNNDNSKLLEDISLLRNELEQLKSDIKKRNIKNTNQVKKQLIRQKVNKVTIRVKEVNLRQAPYLNANIIRKLFFGQAVNIEYCNKYDWCKLKDEEGYLAKFLLQGF